MPQRTNRERVPNYDGAIGVFASCSAGRVGFDEWIGVDRVLLGVIAMKARDLLPIIERVRRATTNGDVLTICDALFKRVQHEIGTTTVRKTVPGGIPPKLSGNRADMVIVDDPHAPDEYLAGITNRDMPRTAMDAVVEHAEGGRKPATGKAKRALAKVAARKAAKKASKNAG